MSDDHERESDARRPTRWLVGIGVAIVCVAAWLLYRGGGARASADATEAASAASAPAESVSAATNAAPVDASDLGAGPPPPPAESAEALLDAGALPPDAPRHVKIGVVLVSYAGAEGAPANARPKAEARALAERLAIEAKSEFHSAVTRGDPGSAEDIGRMPRGVLDPRTELTVFTLGKGETSDAIETARGFWIVKRLD